MPDWWSLGSPELQQSAYFRPARNREVNEAYGRGLRLRSPPSRPAPDQQSYHPPSPPLTRTARIADPRIRATSGSSYLSNSPRDILSDTTTEDHAALRYPAEVGPSAPALVRHADMSAKVRRQELTVPSSSSSGGLPSSPSLVAHMRKERVAASVQPRQFPLAAPDLASTAAPRFATTPTIGGVALVCPQQSLPTKFGTVFTYKLLNAVQSKCFKAVYQSNDNVVVSAPTGSGKTAILELAICKLVADRGNSNFKIVYQAPTKALCSERFRDWSKKFSQIKLQCAELTGDTSQSESWRVGKADIIITTPEKWDSITRKWQDHRKLLQLVELFLIDEVHILKDTRGATLEAVVSRMKTIGSNVRFVALSATVPNSGDIALWLGRDHTTPHVPARREIFGEEFRPVPLQKIVRGYDNNGNDFQFDRFLDSRLPDVIVKHTEGKPLLVFCFTRKSCEATAKLLAQLRASPTGSRLWRKPQGRIRVEDGDLQDLVSYGVAFHHAGLPLNDRILIEQQYLKGELSAICCTSTLAVGVNLPCHTVIIKGTSGFTDGKIQEYSDLEVMQMLGRAGRPQFDKSAMAIILTRQSRKDRYNRMVSGQEILESTLHVNLIEHLNSEIVLRSIDSVQSAKKWLQGTFLSIRLQKNPNHYQLTGSMTEPHTIETKLEEICERGITLLQEARLVTTGERFKSTEHGLSMSKYMIPYETMKLLIKIPRAITMGTLIFALCKAPEFHEFRFKSNEQKLFRDINKDPLIAYPIQEAVTQSWQRVALILQVELGGIGYRDIPDGNKLRLQLNQEKKIVFERILRMLNCIIECKSHDGDGKSVETAIELARSVSAGAWEARSMQLLQIPGIGPAGMRRLASQDVRTVLSLASKQYGEIEGLLGRQPPFGKKISDALQHFPKLAMDVVLDAPGNKTASECPSVFVTAVLRCTNANAPTWHGKPQRVQFLARLSSGTLLHIWRGWLNKIHGDGRHEVKFTAKIERYDDSIDCSFSCEAVVGTIIKRSLDHKLPEAAFPSPEMIRNLIDDDIDDSLLLQAANFVEKPGLDAPVDDFSDDFPDIDELLQVTTTETTAGIQCDNEQAPSANQDQDHAVQLPNGRWKCNHACSGGAPTRLGRSCIHRCCNEGLEKPRKIRVLRKIKQDGDNDGGEGSVEPHVKPRAKEKQAKAAPSLGSIQRKHGQIEFSDQPPKKKLRLGTAQPWGANGETNVIDLCEDDEDTLSVLRATASRPVAPPATTTFPETIIWPVPAGAAVTRSFVDCSDPLSDSSPALADASLGRNSSIPPMRSVLLTQESPFKTGASDETLFEGLETAAEEREAAASGGQEDGKVPDWFKGELQEMFGHLVRFV